MAASITINGRTITARGSITVQNGRVLVDGKEVTPGEEKVITIAVNGDLERIDADVCQTITVSGKVGTVGTQSGDVHCAAVTGSVSTMSGDVTCQDIGGSVSTMSGDVICTARGPAKTMSGRVVGG